MNVKNLNLICLSICMLFQIGDAASEMRFETRSRGTEKTRAMIDSVVSQFLREAFILNRMEIQLAMLATKKAEREEVKLFADKALAYHNRMGADLKKLADNNKISYKDELDGDCKDGIDKLSRISGPLFEKRYLTLSEDNHQKMLQIYRKTLPGLEDVRLKSFISSSIPFLETHNASLRLLIKSAKATSKL